MKDTENQEKRDDRNPEPVSCEKQLKWKNFIRGLTLFSDDFMEDGRGFEGEQDAREAF